MENSELYHHGIIGMKWGVRRTKAQLARAGSKSAKESLKEDKKEKLKKRTVKDLSDTELKALIDRMRMEDTYKQLYASLNPPKSHKGKDFVMSVLEQSGKKVATDLTTQLLTSLIKKSTSKNTNKDEK